MLSTLEIRNAFRSDTVHVASVIAVVIVAYVIYSYFLQQFDRTGVPFYKEGDSEFFQLKKRWMFDSMNLIREAYQKV